MTQPLPSHLEEVGRQNFGLFYAGHPFWRDMVMKSEYRESELIEIYRGRNPHDAKIPWNPISDEDFVEMLAEMRFNVPQAVVDLLDRPVKEVEAAL
jgi:hypothetical protein